MVFQRVAQTISSRLSDVATPQEETSFNAHRDELTPLVLEHPGTPAEESAALQLECISLEPLALESEQNGAVLAGADCF